MIHSAIKTKAKKSLLIQFVCNDPIIVDHLNSIIDELKQEVGDGQRVVKSEVYREQLTSPLKERILSKSQTAA